MNPLEASRETTMTTSPQPSMTSAYPVKYRTYLKASQNKFKEEMERAEINFEKQERKSTNPAKPDRTPEKKPLQGDSAQNSAKFSQGQNIASSAVFPKTDKKSPQRDSSRCSPISYNRTPAAFGDKMREIMKNHIEDLRELIMKFSLASRSGSRTASSLFSFEEPMKRLNIILFGPTGSGKSSLIKTFYQSLYNTTQLPQQIQNNLVIKNLSHNEGTTKFTEIILRPGRQSILAAGEKRMKFTTSEIALFDTRGQIMMDDKEIKQLSMMIEGKVRNLSVVEQRSYRYAYLLWEFWRNNSDLFPNEIMSNNLKKNQPHALIFVFDGSQDEIPNGEDETRFYKGVFEEARRKGYLFPQIVLTRIDKIEEKLDKMYNKQKKLVDESEKEHKLREVIDMKIESVVLKLGVPRSSVHFIENYHSKKKTNEISIDYYALKVLHETLKQGEAYIQTKENRTPLDSCSLF